MIVLSTAETEAAKGPKIPDLEMPRTLYDDTSYLGASWAVRGRGIGMVSRTPVLPRVSRVLFTFLATIHQASESCCMCQTTSSL